MFRCVFIRLAKAWVIMLLITISCNDLLPDFERPTIIRPCAFVRFLFIFFFFFFFISDLIENIRKSIRRISRIWRKILLFFKLKLILFVFQDILFKSLEFSLPSYIKILLLILLSFFLYQI